jgi:LacI family transcriptional regulator
MAEVAAAAGVSPTTVSHALSGKRHVAEATRERILRTVAELDYRPNLVARGLRKQETQTIALIVPDIANPYYPASARALNDGLSSAGYLTLIGNTDGDPGLEAALLRDMVARGIDGIAMHSLSTAPAKARQIVGPSVPLVMAGSDDGSQSADLIATDDAAGIGEAVRHLAASGIRDVGFISGPEGQTPGVFRLTSYRAATQALGLHIDPSWIVNTTYTRDGGFAAATRVLSAPTRPQAVLCANDLIAIGVLDAARAIGLRVPEDLAVVGFDDIETAALVSPRLTTVVNSSAMVGARFADLLLRRIEHGPGAPFEQVVLPTSLVLRESA